MAITINGLAPFIHLSRHSVRCSWISRLFRHAGYHHDLPGVLKCSAMRPRLILLIIGIPFLAVAIFYAGVVFVMGYAANDGEIAGSSVVARTTDGHRYVLQPGTRLHYKGEAILDGRHVLKVRIEEGPLKGSTLLVPEHSIMLNGRYAAL